METVLLIENDPANLVAQTLILRSFGYNVLEADSGEEALRVCHEHTGPIHLVVAKAVPDHADSKEAVAWLQPLHPQIRALFVSDAPLTERADKPSIPSKCAFLEKPFRVDTFAHVIRELLRCPEEKAFTSVS
jgi:two-component system cell cycle sensor histidine kinase/response regulator CckA